MATIEFPRIGIEKPDPAWSQEELPDEVRLELTKGNLVRAAHVAEQMGVSREKVRDLQSDAIRHFIERLHNFEGAKKLMSSYGVEDDEVRAIIKEILENPKSQTESMTWFNWRKGRMLPNSLAQRIQSDPVFGKYL